MNHYYAVLVDSALVTNLIFFIAGVYASAAMTAYGRFRESQKMARRAFEAACDRIANAPLAQPKGEWFRMVTLVWEDVRLVINELKLEGHHRAADQIHFAIAPIVDGAQHAVLDVPAKLPRSAGVSSISPAIFASLPTEEAGIWFRLAAIEYLYNSAQGYFHVVEGAQANWSIVFQVPSFARIWDSLDERYQKNVRTRRDRCPKCGAELYDNV